VRRAGGNVTIGIGCLCNGGETIIMAADTRGTYRDPSIPNHERIGKQFDLSIHGCANFAGHVPICTSVISELCAEIDKLATEPVIYHDHIRNAIRNAQFHEHVFRLDYEMVKKLGMPLLDWKAMNQTTLAYRRGAKLANRFELDMHLTVAAYVRGSAVLLEALYSDPAAMVHTSVIGSGYDHAIDVLNNRGQDANTSWQRTLVHVAEAMQAARADQYVGAPSDFVVLTPRSLRRFPADDAYLGQLLVKYWGKDTGDMDDTDEALKKLKTSLYFPNTTKEEMAKGRRRPMGAGLPIPDRREERTEDDWMVTLWADGRKTFSLPKGSTAPII